MAKTNKLKLHCPIVLLCERKEIAEFIGAYIRHLFKQGVNLPNLQIVNLGSIEDLPKFLSYVTEHEDISGLKSIRLIADAGESMRKRVQYLEAVKFNSFLREHKDFDYYLFPGKKTIYWSKGYLEDVLVSCLKQESSEKAAFANLFNITQDFLLSINCCRGKESFLKNHNRHLLYAYFAGTEKYAGQSFGEAIQAGAFDLEQEAFKNLKDMLMELKEQK